MSRIGKTYAAVPLIRKFRIVGIQGDASITLANFTLSADAYITVSGDAGITISPFTISSDGSVRITGDSSITLSAFTLASTLSAIITGDGSITISAFTLSSDGSLTVTGNASNTLSDFTLSSDGSLTVTGDSSNTLGAFTLSADGSLTITGNASNTLSNFTLSAGASSVITGDADIDLGAFLITARGYRVVRLIQHSGTTGINIHDSKGNTFLDFNASGQTMGKGYSNYAGTQSDDTPQSLAKLNSFDVVRIAENNLITVEDTNTSTLSATGDSYVLQIMNKTDSTWALYTIFGTTISKQIGDSSFVDVSPASGEIGVYEDSGYIIIENNTGHDVDMSRLILL